MLEFKPQEGDRKSPALRPEDLRFCRPFGAGVVTQYPPGAYALTFTHISRLRTADADDIK